MTEVVALVFLSLRSFNGSRLEINRDHFAQLYIHVGVTFENPAQGKSRIARRQYRGRHLVEQGLELLIVILIDQRDPNIRVRCQFTSTVQTGKPATDDNDVLHMEILSDPLDQPWKQVNLHGTNDHSLRNVSESGFLS
jgi:hypothetical protein